MKDDIWGKEGRRTDDGHWGEIDWMVLVDENFWWITRILNRSNLKRNEHEKKGKVYKKITKQDL